MTIHEHDRVSADRDGQGRTPEAGDTHALVDRLTAGEPYAVAFGGQGSAWLETLEELVSSAGIESDLATLVGEADLLLEPVAKELVVVRPIGFEPLHVGACARGRRSGSLGQAPDLGRGVDARACCSPRSPPSARWRGRAWT